MSQLIRALIRGTRKASLLDTILKSESLQTKMKIKDKTQIKYLLFITAKISEICNFYRNYWGKQEILVLMSRLFVFQMGLRYIGLDWDQIKATSSGWWLVWDDCPPQSLKQAIPHFHSWVSLHKLHSILSQIGGKYTGSLRMHWGTFQRQRRLKIWTKKKNFSSFHQQQPLYPSYHSCIFSLPSWVWLLTPHNQDKCGESSHSPLPSWVRKDWVCSAMRDLQKNLIFYFKKQVLI